MELLEYPYATPAGLPEYDRFLRSITARSNEYLLHLVEETCRAFEDGHGRVACVAGTNRIVGHQSPYHRRGPCIGESHVGVYQSDAVVIVAPGFSPARSSTFTPVRAALKGGATFNSGHHL
jgi:hypothetical protein